MKWVSKLLAKLQQDPDDLLRCSGGCGRTMEATLKPNYNSKMLPLGMDGIPRYERYIYLTGFTCDKCYCPENPEPPESNNDSLAA